MCSLPLITMVFIPWRMLHKWNQTVHNWDWQFSLGITLLRSVQIVFASLVLFIPVSLLNSIPWYRYIRVCLSIHPLEPFKLLTNKNWYDHLYERLRRRQWHPTPVPLPGKSHGQRSLVGCSPWGCKKSDTTERLHFHFSLSCIGEGNGNPLQCFCRENPRDGGAWWAVVYGVAQSWTWLKQLSSSSSYVKTRFSFLNKILCQSLRWSSKWNCAPLQLQHTHLISPWLLQTLIVPRNTVWKPLLLGAQPLSHDGRFGVIRAAGCQDMDQLIPLSLWRLTTLHRGTTQER